MKQRIIGIIITTLLLLIIFPIISAVLNFIVFESNLDINLIKSINLKDYLNIKTYSKFFDYTNVFNAFFMAFIVVSIITALINNADVNKREKFKQNVKYGSHGTARFQTNKEMLGNYSQDKLGWFLGNEKNNKTYKLGMESFYHSVNGDLNMQMTVIGPPGTKKTTGLIFPNIFHLVNEYKNGEMKGVEMPDFIITDPKPEIILSTYKYLKDNNYNIVIYDFIYFKYGDKINIIDFIDEEEKEEQLIDIAEGYVRSVEGSMGNSSGDNSFWTEQEGQAFAGLLGAVEQTYLNPKIEDVLDLLTNKFTNREDGSLDVVKANKYFADKVTGAPLQLWKNFLLICKSENTAGNILGGLAGKLKLFSIKGVKNLTSESTFDIRQVGAKIGDFNKKQPTAIFLFMKAESRTYAPLINVVITTILNQLYSTARFYDGVLPNPAYFILEEMANIGKISGMQEKLGTMRGARIYPMMIWQSLTQMKDRYKDGWGDILSQCDTRVYLGANDDFTAKYCSNELGNTTINIQGISSKNKGFGIKDEGESSNYTQRKLMFPEEITSMSRKELIIVQGGHSPCKMKKVQYKHWSSKHRLCEKIKISDLPLIGTNNTFEKKYKIIEIKEEEQNLERKKEVEQEKEIQTEYDIEKEGDKEKEIEISHNKDDDLWNKRNRDLER